MTFFLHDNGHQVTHIQMKSCCVSSPQALVLSNAARQNASVGAIVNLVVVDLNMIYRILMQLNYFWATPIVVILCTVFLWQQIGASCLAGLLLLAVFMPTNFIYLANKLKKVQVPVFRWCWYVVRHAAARDVWHNAMFKVYLLFLSQRKQMQLKDQRLKLTSQILSGIKVWFVLGFVPCTVWWIVWQTELGCYVSTGAKALCLGAIFWQWTTWHTEARNGRTAEDHSTECW